VEESLGLDIPQRVDHLSGLFVFGYILCRRRPSDNNTASIPGICTDQQNQRRTKHSQRFPLPSTRHNLAFVLLPAAYSLRCPPYSTTSPTIRIPGKSKHLIEVRTSLDLRNVKLKLLGLQKPKKPRSSTLPDLGDSPPTVPRVSQFHKLWSPLAQSSNFLASAPHVLFS
jgi:hypothetical protein